MERIIYLSATTLFAVLLHFEAASQTDAAKTARVSSILMTSGQQSSSFNNSGFMILMPPDRSTEVEGNPYWDEHWGASSVQLEGQSTSSEGHLTRYDVLRNEFEFFLPNRQVKVAQGKSVKNVVWIDSLTGKPRLLVNAKEYTLEGAAQTGFLEILVEGDKPLIKKVALQVLKPNYNVAMSTGSKNSRITKRTEFYSAKNKELFEIKSRKSLEPLFGQNQEQMESFIRMEKLKAGNEIDLVRIFEKLASLQSNSAN